MRKRITIYYGNNTIRYIEGECLCVGGDKIQNIDTSVFNDNRKIVLRNERRMEIATIYAPQDCLVVVDYFY